jgi:hypothetical protein
MKQFMEYRAEARFVKPLKGLGGRKAWLQIGEGVAEFWASSSESWRVSTE